MFTSFHRTAFCTNNTISHLMISFSSLDFPFLPPVFVSNLQLVPDCTFLLQSRSGDFSRAAASFSIFDSLAYITKDQDKVFRKHTFCKTQYHTKKDFQAIWL